MDQFLDPETDTKHQFLDPETVRKCQFLVKKLLDPETDIMDQFLDPETDKKHQFLDPETDKKCQFLDGRPETDVMDQFLDPETDIMGERNNIQGIKTLLRANTVFRCQECAKVSRLITYLASKVGIGTGGENY